MLKLNERGPDGLVGGTAPGPQSPLDDQHRAALVKVVEDGSIPATHGVVRSRIIDLCQWLREALALTVSKQTLSHTASTRLSHAIGPAMPSCASGGRHQGFKKSLPARMDAIRRA